MLLINVNSHTMVTTRFDTMQLSSKGELRKIALSSAEETLSLMSEAVILSAKFNLSKATYLKKRKFRFPEARDNLDNFIDKLIRMGPRFYREYSYQNGTKFHTLDGLYDISNFQKLYKQYSDYNILIYADDKDLEWKMTGNETEEEKKYKHYASLEDLNNDVLKTLEVKYRKSIELLVPKQHKYHKEINDYVFKYAYFTMLIGPVCFYNEYLQEKANDNPIETNERRILRNMDKMKDEVISFTQKLHGLDNMLTTEEEDENFMKHFYEKDFHKEMASGYQKMTRNMKELTHRLINNQSFDDFEFNPPMYYVVNSRENEFHTVEEVNQQLKHNQDIMNERKKNKKNNGNTNRYYTEKEPEVKDDYDDQEIDDILNDLNNMPTNI